MKLRFVRGGLGVLVVAALLLAGGPALGAPGKPLTSVTWKEATPLPFPGTRFDGAVDPATNRVYFLGFRLADNSTDGSVWYYDIATKTYTDTGLDMPVPISNSSIAVLTTPRDWASTSSAAATTTASSSPMSRSTTPPPTRPRTSPPTRGRGPLHRGASACPRWGWPW